MAIKKALDAEFPGKVRVQACCCVQYPFAVVFSRRLLPFWLPLPHACNAQVNCVGEATPNVSGLLEIRIENTGALVHSKKGGDGYVDTPEKMLKIKDAVKAALGL